mgnify:CR=1 FL=1
MNKKKEPWVDCVWTPFSGCLRNCKDCPAKKQVVRFSGDARLHLTSAKTYEDTEIRVLDNPFPASKPNFYIDFPYGMIPTFHRYRLDSLSKWKKGRNVLVCSLGDLFGDWVPDEIIDAVFDACKKHPQHNYLFLTKNPARYSTLAEKGKLPQLPNMGYGTNVSDTEDCWFTSGQYNTFVLISVKDDVGEMFLHTPLLLQNWVIIEPSVNKADELAQYCNANGVPVYMIDGNVMQLPERLKYHPHVKHPLQDGRCSFCKDEMSKKAMVSLLYREKRGASAYALGFACPECFKKLKAKMDADEPAKGYGHEKPQ